ncbi:hypothetical protein NEIRO03_0849 [Nematocida sp. AWRm78]|nr:hypothetical protein NEIRO02_1114 [Nematocida sp. AWRm79]KAI5183234.1 hypothetical protein NEIRO03_0849 [Nematocida sp. AWRm78]
MDNSPVILKNPYTLTREKAEACEKKLERLEEEGIISKAPVGAYASRGMLIPKKDRSEWRLLVDYRMLNGKTESIAYPFPNLYDTIREIPPGMKMFSQIDLRQGYHQVEIEPNSKKYTGFIIEKYHYVYNRMPFGLKNAPQLFQKIIVDRVGDLPFVKVFLDNILVYSQNREEHNRHLCILAERFRKYNIILNYKKSHFYQSRVHYLGHIISENGVQADARRIQEIRNMPPPRTLKELMQFLGRINWFRPYIPDLSQLAERISDKLGDMNKTTDKQEPIQWTEDDEKRRMEIFDLIERQITLSSPVAHVPYALCTDACATGMGAILIQLNKLIGMYSQKFISAERNYTVEEQELLAIIKSLRHFRGFVADCKITVYTDHKNLLCMRTLDSSRAERWKIQLQKYDVTLELW